MRNAIVSAMIFCASCSSSAGEEPPAFASPEYLQLYLPAKTPYTHLCGCARLECKGYNKPTFLAWDLNRPMELRCTACETVYPNKGFPEDKYFEVEGKRYQYHEDANGKQHHFTGKAAYHRVIRAMYDARYAAQDYRKTGDVERGKQARDILLRFAEVYPNWFYARAPTMTPGEEPYFPEVPGNAGAGRLKQYFGDYGLPSFFCAIYEPLAGSDLLTEEQRLKVRALLEDCIGTCVMPYFKLYRLTGNTAGQIFADFVQTGKAFPDLKIHDLVHEYHFKDERVLSGADLVHEIIDGSYGIGNLLANGFHADGFWHEGSLSYQSMVLHGLVPCLELLRGYSDPVDYQPLNPEWKRLDDFQPTQWPDLRRALYSLPLLALPDGGILPIGDSHKRTKIVPDWEKTLADFTPPEGLSVPTESSFHDGIGVAAVRCGKGPDATAAFLTYGPRGGGHSHYDQLNLTYYSLGHELATDIGYPGSTDPLRNTWWNRAAGHNTVVVDGQNQAQSIGRLEAFATSPRFRIVQARCANAYPHLEDYRRTLVLVGDAEDEGSPRYLIDVFHVVGGTTHDYCFHGQSEPEMPQAEFVTKGIDLGAVADETKTLLDFTPGAEPKTMGYDFVDHLRRGTATQPWQAEWRINDEHDTRLRLLRLPSDEDEVFVGQASGHRVYPGHAKVDIGKKMTWLGCRRIGEAPRHSTFVSVVEAHRGEGSLIHGTTTTQLAGDAVAVEIRHAGGTDIVVVGRKTAELHVPDSGVALNGRIGAVALNPGGKPRDALLIDGASLVFGGKEIVKSSPSPVGRIRAVVRGVSGDPLVIEMTGEIPREATGRVLTINHANSTGSAWLIEGVASARNGTSRLTLDRSAREAQGRIGKLSDDGRTVFTNAGFHRLEESMNALFYDGMWLVVGDQWRQIESVTMHGRADPFLWEVRLTESLADAEGLVGARCVLARVGVGDAVRVCSVGSLR